MNDQDQDRYYYKVANSPKGMSINFDNFGKIKIIAGDIEDCDISGGIKNIHDFNRTNFSRCRLDQVNAEQADFSSGDFKDCLIKSSRFSNVNFGRTHLNTCYVVDVLLEKCFFKLTNFNKADFDNVTFSRCVFDDVLVKSCSFQNCRFLDCDINNKLFENCQMLNTEIVNTDLQIQSILDNYGFKKDLWINSYIRTARKREKHSVFSIDELLDNYKGKDVFASLKIDFFFNGFCEEFFRTLDILMDIESWKAFLTTPTTFYDQISGLSFFLNKAFENNEICIYPLLKLSEFIYDITENLRSSYSYQANDLFSSLLGLHIANAKRTETYLHSLARLMQLKEKTIIFLVNGPLHVDYYIDNCPEIFADNSLQFIYLKEHNSPNELAFNIVTAGGGLTALAAFLASRLQIEITQIQSNPLTIPDEKEDVESFPIVPVFSIFAGRSIEEKMMLELRVKSILPGSLMADLRLTFSLASVNKLRKVLSGILFPEKY